MWFATGILSSACAVLAGCTPATPPLAKPETSIRESPSDIPREHTKVGGQPSPRQPAPTVVPALEKWFAELTSSSRVATLAERTNARSFPSSAHGALYSKDGRVVVRLVAPDKRSWCVASHPTGAATYYSCLFALFDRNDLHRNYVVEGEGPTRARLTARSSALGCRRALVAFGANSLELAASTRIGHVYRLEVGTLEVPKERFETECKK